MDLGPLDGAPLDVGSPDPGSPAPIGPGRELTAAVTAALQNVVTTPVFLVELDWTAYGGSLHRYSTYGDITWNGNVYGGGDLVVESFTNAEQGSPASAVVVFPSPDQTLVDLVYGNDWRAVDARMWMTYKDAYAVDDPVQLLVGRIDGTRLNKDDCIIYLVSQTALSSKSPRITCRPPLFNCLPPDGTVFVWGNGSLTITRRQ